MPWDDLDELHSPLRENGWVSKYDGEREDGHGKADFWRWKHADYLNSTEFDTALFQKPLRVQCLEISRDRWTRIETNIEHDAQSLGKRLQELTKKSLDDPIAQMHLTLREHGWEPELQNPVWSDIDECDWRHPDHPDWLFTTVRIVTEGQVNEGQVYWESEWKTSPETLVNEDMTSVEELRELLDDIATGNIETESTAAPRPSDPEQPPADR